MSKALTIESMVEAINAGALGGNFTAKADGPYALVQDNGHRVPRKLGKLMIVGGEVDCSQAKLPSTMNEAKVNKWIMAELAK